MAAAVRIGNAHGFWGDRIAAAREMLSAEPALDYLTLDFLAEVSMSILAVARQRDATKGYAQDFVEVVESLVPYWQSGGRCRIVTNAGGLNPLDCARVCRDVLQQAGCGDRSVAVITGDDVIERLHDENQSRSDRDHSANLDTGQAIDEVIDRVTTANAYLGAVPIAQALSRGADLVITGRVADPSLTVGPCLHHFGWESTDHDRIAGATIAGHLIECGTQVTGGISTDWLALADRIPPGFPIVEVAEDGSCIVTKPTGSGGCVSEATVKEQLLYEIADPGNYLSPDVRVSFLSLKVQQESRDRVSVHGARGQPPTEFYKVSATYQNGYRAAGQLTIFGIQAALKAKKAGEVVFEQMAVEGVTFQNQVMEVLGAGGCSGNEFANEFEDRCEVVLRIAVADRNRESVEHFARAMMPLITAGPPGTTGYSEGRPRVHPHVGYWPCLIRRDRVAAEIEFLPPTERRDPSDSVRPMPAPSIHSSPARSQSPERKPNLCQSTLVDISHARSGDKGSQANIGVIARCADDYVRLLDELTIVRVADHLRVKPEEVTRHELPNLAALNFVIRDILANPLRVDAQGKTLGQRLLQLPLDSQRKSRS